MHAIYREYIKSGNGTVIHDPVLNAAMQGLMYFIDQTLDPQYTSHTSRYQASLEVCIVSMLEKIDNI